MKSILFSIALTALSTASFAQSGIDATATASEKPKKAITSLKIGSPIPMATVGLQATNGNMISLAKTKTEKGLLVMFSCNTCPYVVKSQPRTLEIMNMAKQMGVGMVVLNSNEAQRGDADSYKAMVAYAEEQKYFMPYAIDKGNKLADAFGATRTPEVFLFDGKGVLIYKGAMEDNPSDPASSKEMYLANAIKNAAGGEKISPTETKSIGCSIKRAE